MVQCFNAILSCESLPASDIVHTKSTSSVCTRNFWVSSRLYLSFLLLLLLVLLLLCLVFVRIAVTTLSRRLIVGTDPDRIPEQGCRF